MYSTTFIIYYTVFTVFTFLTLNMDTYDLKIAAWNSRGVAAAIPYIKTLLKENDIVVIEEHQLYDNELYKLRDICYSCYSLHKNSVKGK